LISSEEIKAGLSEAGFENIRLIQEEARMMGRMMGRMMRLIEAYRPL